MAKTSGSPSSRSRSTRRERTGSAQAGCRQSLNPRRACRLLLRGCCRDVRPVSAPRIVRKTLRRPMSSISCTSPEGLQLNRAFVRISDAEGAPQVIDLVKALAAEDEVIRPLDRRAIARRRRSRKSVGAGGLARLFIWLNAARSRLDGIDSRFATRSHACPAAGRTFSRGDTRDAAELSLHLRIRFRRPSGQGLRPHLRRDRRSGLSRSARRPAWIPWDVRVACETLATTNRVVIAGEVRVPIRC